MWPFSKKKLSDLGFFEGYTDFHCHILPGVDDGFQEMEQSLSVLDDYAGAGVRKVWLTPHIMEDMPNTTDALRSRFDELHKAYKGPIELHLAAENMLDGLFDSRLASRDLLPIGDNGDHLLVETSYYNPPMGLENILAGIMSAGYFPMLAHPERYNYMTNERYLKIKNMGVKFQLNLPSLAGFYSRGTYERARWLLKQGMYDFIGTDLHNKSTWFDILDSSFDSSTRKQLLAIPNKF